MRLLIHNSCLQINSCTTPFCCHTQGQNPTLTQSSQERKKKNRCRNHTLLTCCQCRGRHCGTQSRGKRCAVRGSSHRGSEPQTCRRCLSPAHAGQHGSDWGGRKQTGLQHYWTQHHSQWTYVLSILWTPLWNAMPREEFLMPWQVVSRLSATCLSMESFSSSCCPALFSLVEAGWHYFGLVHSAILIGYVFSSSSIDLHCKLEPKTLTFYTEIYMKGFMNIYRWHCVGQKKWIYGRLKVTMNQSYSPLVPDPNLFTLYCFHRYYNWI